MRDRDSRQSNLSRHLMVGLIFISVGILFLLSRMNIFYGMQIASRSWPLILIGVGAFQLTQEQCSTRRYTGIFWIVVGVLFLAVTNGYLHFNIWGLFWPVGLIWFGVSMVLRSRRPQVSATDDSTSNVSGMAFLGGFDRRCTSQDFQGGEITCVMAGGKIDLREAAIAGDKAVIHVVLWMGGLELMIPDNWLVVSNVIPIMGGVSDRTRQPREGAKRLVIEGTLLMGGVEVKN